MVIHRRFAFLAGLLVAPDALRSLVGTVATWSGDATGTTDDGIEHTVTITAVAETADLRPCGANEVL